MYVSGRENTYFLKAKIIAQLYLKQWIAYSNIPTSYAILPIKANICLCCLLKINEFEGFSELSLDTECLLTMF